MKRSIFKIFVLTVILILSFSASVFAQADVSKNASEEVINVIKLLEIANGNEKGDMNYDKNVTRAEFVKMTINASPWKEAAANIKLNISLFPDVKNSYWGASYISVAINNGLVNGYIDGTFKPNNPVTLEEAATIILRLLGYTNSDLVGSYPSAQLQKYKDLELNTNISAQRGDKLTREECMLLIYNALSAKTKAGSVYCTSLGLSTNSEGKLDYSSLLEEKLDGPIVVSDSEKTFENTGFIENEKTKYILNNANSSRSAISEKDVIYYSDIINTVFIYRKTATGIVNSTSASTVTISGKTYNLSTSLAKDKLSLGGEFNEEKSFVTLVLGINDGVVDVIKGDISKISENSDNSSHLSMIDATISNAIYLDTNDASSSWKSMVPFNTDDAITYFNGNKTSSPDVLTHDVLYYSKAFNSIWIYRKTISGTIEQITPATSPSSVTISGKTYSVATSEAAYDLSIYGSYEIGDRVTAILGINNECVALTDTKTTSSIIYGVVTALGEKKYTDKNGDDYTADYVTVTDTTATAFTYEFDNSRLRIGDAVKVSVAENVVISKIKTEIGRSAAVTLTNSIKQGKFTSDCEIIDIKGSDVIKVKPSRITGVTIDPEHFQYYTTVLYYQFDDNGNLSKLILKDFTGDYDEYGVVTSSSPGKIKYMTDQNESTLITEGTGCSLGPARLKKENGIIVNASPLLGLIDNLSSLTNLSAYDENNKEYLLADNVKVFIRNASNYTYSNITEVNTGNYNLSAYYDKLPENGGRIRVIIATRKV